MNIKRLALVAIAGIFLFASCRKDRTCVCTTASGTQDSKNYTNITKKLAKQDCEYYETTGYYTSCELN